MCVCVYIYMIHFPEGPGYFFTTFSPTFYQANIIGLFLQGQSFYKVACALSSPIHFHIPAGDGTQATVVTEPLLCTVCITHVCPNDFAFSCFQTCNYILYSS